TFDRKLLVERAIDARELEVSVLGNDEPQASVVGEVVPAHEFYDYEAKYLDEGSRLLIPAPIAANASEDVRSMAIQAFLAVDAAGRPRCRPSAPRRRAAGSGPWSRSRPWQARSSSSCSCWPSRPFDRSRSRSAACAT